MSSILKALKRVEREKQGRDFHGNVLQGSGVPPDSGWFGRQVVVAAGLVLAAVLMVCFFYFGDQAEAPEHPSAPPLAEPAGHDLKTSHGMNNDKKVDRPEPASIRPLRFPDKERWIKGATIRDSKDESVAVSPPEPAGFKEPVKNHTDSAEKKDFSPGKEAPEKERAPLTVLPPKELPRRVDRPGLELYEKGDLTLQAIAWNEIPENRIAVVNGRVVREQDHVNGVRIHRINRDDLVIDKAGSRTILKMGP